MINSFNKWGVVTRPDAEEAGLDYENIMAIIPVFMEYLGAYERHDSVYESS
jgi:hypothetical protein